MKRFSRITICMLLFVLLALSVIPAQLARAHGGFVIDSGEIDNYEWAVSIFPYPVLTGATVLSILLFDKTSNAPAMDLTGEVYLAEPGDTRPCCEPGIHRGPFQLTSDHTLYPGDYTTFIPVDVAGRWQVLFKMKSPNGEYGVVTGFDAIPFGDGSQPVDKAAIATQVSIAFSAAATASAQRVAIPQGTPQFTMSIPQPDSPLSAAVQPNSPIAAVIDGERTSEEVTNTSLLLPVVANSANVGINDATAEASDNNRIVLIGIGLGLVVIVGVVFTVLTGRKNGNQPPSTGA